MSRRAKFSAEEKLVLVRSCLDGEQSVSEASRKFHVDRKSINEWIRQYETEGVCGLAPGKRNRKYAPERKRAAVKAYLSGEGSLQEICKKYKIHSDFQLRKWIKVYNAHGDFNSRKNSGGGSYMKQGRETTLEC